MKWFSKKREEYKVDKVEEKTDTEGLLKESEDVEKERRVKELTKKLGNTYSREDAIINLQSLQSDLGDEKTVDFLIKALYNDNSVIRKGAARAFMTTKYGGQSIFDENVIRDKGVVEHLIKALLHDKDSSVRVNAANALGNIFIFHKSAIGPLIKALQDEDSYVKERAAWALGQTREKKAVVPLAEALKDENYEVRRTAALALNTVAEGGDRRLEAKKAVGPLIKALQDEDEDVRKYATWALEKIGDGIEEVPLIEALEDEDQGPEVREIDAWALGEFRHGMAVGPLIKALRDENSKVRRNAAKALGEIGDGSEIDLLIEALGAEYEAPEVREAAAWALGEIGELRAIPALEEATADLDEDLREYAREALQKIKASPLYHQNELEEDIEREDIEDKIRELKEEVNKVSSHPPTISIGSIGEVLGAGAIKMGDVGMVKGGIGSTENPFSKCPYCGEVLNLRKTPKFCPYCGKQLR